MSMIFLLLLPSLAVSARVYRLPYTAHTQQALRLGTGVSTIDIPSAIRYIQATFAGQTGLMRSMLDAYAT